eukprot:CAMPEP_0183755862 /NCGR_PEP_ID=MMETSP0739-20130205/4565_1 /TAXON_ID=385413 /ORGANISM="Thalassiosira miniscula, Strain CCMP1093" /LENGTH=1102 /DNA_ID=CAMNT_0025992861 /DNA_START=157 /DNA_END=3465 /DNA_ORIENTATION=+
MINAKLTLGLAALSAASLSVHSKEEGKPILSDQLNRAKRDLRSLTSFLLDEKEPAANESMVKVHEIPNDDAPTALIFSDRLDGIIPTIGSMVRSASVPVNIILIGKEDINKEAYDHFHERTGSFITMTVEEAQEDLIEQGLNPIWKWDEWHSSSEPGWKNDNTIHVAEWDDLHTHAHELNHLRFYIPYLSVVKNTKHVFFIDDDLLIQKDLAEVTKIVADKVSPTAGLTCPCNIWMWNADCHHFDFKSQYANILEVSPLYGGRPECQDNDEDFCLPKNWDEFVKEATPKGLNAEDQTAWNFGFCLFHSENWKELELTQKYEDSMKTNYRLHEVPETSLVFGLGIPFLAFTGAVECWDEDDMKVRDGFGFIDWQRYEKTFGNDFFKSVDVAHYTGPSKPWAPNSPVEENALKPWLNMMETEGLDAPEQLPPTGTEELFAVLTSPRSGSEWLMTMLDQHPEVCASGESSKPEMGFPTESMLSQATSWLPVCSIKKGCTLGFVLDGVNEFTNGGTVLDPPQCQTGFSIAHADSNIDGHRERICNFIRALDGDFSKESIVLKWTEAFLNEDKRFLGCGCPRGSKIKGLKMMSGWLGSESSINYISNMADTVFNGAKIIRLKRTNLWDRYKSLLKAQVTALWHARSDEDVAGKDVMLKVPVEQMVEDVEWMKQVDDEADEWAKEYGSDVMFVDYEECKAQADTCRAEMFEFLGVDGTKFKSEASISAFAKSKDPLHGVENRDEVTEALGVNGFGSFIGQPDYTQLQLLIYETEPLETSPAARHVRRADEMRGINVTVIGQETTFRGFGSKYAAAVSALKDLPRDSLVVLSDSRDVITNIHQAKSHGQHVNLYSSLNQFRKNFDSLTSDSKGAIVVSTEAQCCVTALGHIKPGDLFAKDGKRTGRACSSGSPNCVWKGVEQAKPWNDFMEERAVEQGKDEVADIYLNAGLIAGKAKDLLKVIKALDLEEDEDDQAVLTAFMYRNPKSIVLDYDQSMFGNNRWALGEEDGCMFDVPADEKDEAPVGRRLEHIETGASPLFIHSPGRFMDCHQGLLDKLQVTSERSLKIHSVNSSGAASLTTPAPTPPGVGYRINFRRPGHKKNGKKKTD